MPRFCLQYLYIIKKLCCKNVYVVSTKKIFQVKNSAAHKSYVAHKNLCCGNIKNYVTPKREINDGKICLVLHRVVCAAYNVCCSDQENLVSQEEPFDVAKKILKLVPIKVIIFLERRAMQFGFLIFLKCGFKILKQAPGAIFITCS